RVAAGGWRYAPRPPQSLPAHETPHARRPPQAARWQLPRLTRWISGSSSHPPSLLSPAWVSAAGSSLRSHFAPCRLRLTPARRASVSPLPGGLPSHPRPVRIHERGLHPLPATLKRAAHGRSRRLLLRDVLGTHLTDE